MKLHCLAPAANYIVDLKRKVKDRQSRMLILFLMIAATNLISLMVPNYVRYTGVKTSGNEANSMADSTATAVMFLSSGPPQVNPEVRTPLAWSNLQQRVSSASGGHASRDNGHDDDAALPNREHHLTTTTTPTNTYYVPTTVAHPGLRGTATHVTDAAVTRAIGQTGPRRRLTTYTTIRVLLPRRFSVQQPLKPWVNSSRTTTTTRLTIIT